MSLLELRDVTAGYGAKLVISDVSLTLAAGEIVALLGHNGAGKTTTLKTIMGLLPARSGAVSLMDQDVSSLATPGRIKLGLRLLPEGRGIFPDLSVADNIEAVAAQNCKGGDLFGPAEVYQLLPVLDERRTTIAGTMSGGQQQMLALSLALLGRPHCLMLDEPSIGLAPNLVERMFDQLRSLSRSHGLGTLLVEQNVAAAMRVADRVIIMNSGKIVFSGTPDGARAAGVWHYF
ncbi:ABC transporter ATP-binding protein [Acidisoma cellulosilytica]|uniref:ABC transporter ATP-binding protein n=1 Tax=Acidisoma cellulosilyticum TaxID=2802395 RepID=A0A964E638_9PROT|nr:ABC transporter ATP-binding protein [Acidisoma cellulosilyticum]MCB8883097.1 ABC transporter ATP-binding protein [Acidisoma cellulosilyticum]